MKRRTQFNPKRKIRQNPGSLTIEQLAEMVDYGGNPEHKCNPGDFGLIPPSQPRADKTLCDSVNICSKEEAKRLLKAGVLKGLVSESERNTYPQNIWAVTDDGQPLEAQLENQDKGTYHGYPMPETDPFREEVLKYWNNH